MKKILQLASLAFIFAAPVIFVIARYSQDREAYTVPAQSGLGGLGFILVLIVGFVAVLFVWNIIRSKVQDNPLGPLAVSFYALIMVVLFASLWYGSNYIVKEATLRLDSLVDTFEGYKSTMMWLTSFVAIGLFLQAVVAWLNFKQK